MGRPAALHETCGRSAAVRSGKQEIKPPTLLLSALTRVHSKRAHSLPFGEARQLLTEVDVGQFAAAVGEEGQQVVVQVLEVQLLVFVAGACERYHPAGGALLQAGQKQVSQQEVTQVVDPKTHAEAIVRPVQDAGHPCGDEQQ